MAYNTIKIKRYTNVVNEWKANTALTPGSVVELLSTGKVRKHATAGGNVIPLIVLEDELQGKGINDDYVADDIVQVWAPNRGDEAYLLLADEEDVDIGDFLESDGFGLVKKHTAETWGSADAQESKPIIGIALEAKNLSVLPEGSDSSAGGEYYNPRIKVMIV
jgi:hypothetical protein